MARGSLGNDGEVISALGSDMWAIGVMAFYLFTCPSPFWPVNQPTAEIMLSVKALHDAWVSALTVNLTASLIFCWYIPPETYVYDVHV